MKKLEEKDFRGPCELRKSSVTLDLSYFALWMRGLNMWEWRGHLLPFQELHKEALPVCWVLRTDLDLLPAAAVAPVWYKQPC